MPSPKTTLLKIKGLTLTSRKEPRW